MKLFLLKCSIFPLFFGLMVASTVYFDTFNVFHWKNIRFTSAEPNKNFVKTKYVINNPQKFNAFVFGSSRVGHLPQKRLPKESDAIRLNWYNMTYSEGIPGEHLLTMKTLLKNGVKIKAVIVEFDNISMYASIEQHKAQLLRMPYQVYDENEFAFFLPYLKTPTAPTIIKQTLHYDRTSHKEESENFYNYSCSGGDFSLAENPDMKRYECGKISYTQKNAYKDLEDIVSLCAQNGIELILFTTPMYQTTYLDSVEAGYFDFLRSVAQKCSFYNFSSLNNYTTDPHYYFEWSHYRPALGLEIEKVLFGSEEEKAEVRRAAADDFFGTEVNRDNIEEVLQNLQAQINER